MNTSSRSLVLESVEDRSLPSTYYFALPTFVNFAPAHTGTSSQALVGYLPAGWETRAFSSEGAVVRIRFEEPIFVYRQTASDFQQSEVFVGNSTLGPSGSGSSQNNSATDNSSQGGGGNGPIAPQPRVATRSAADAAAGFGNVALAVNAGSTNGNAAAAADQSGTAGTRLPLQVATPILVPTNQTLAGHGAGYANTAILGTADATDLVVPPPADELPAPPPAPSPDGAGSSTIVQIAAAAVGPVAGLLPMDLSALRSGATLFLDRVADLAPEWPDAMPSLSDSLWIGAATLMAGGAIYAASNRSPSRTVRDPFRTGTGLTDWEPRNAGQAG